MLSVDWYPDQMPRYKAAFEDWMLDLPKDGIVPRTIAQSRSSTECLASRRAAGGKSASSASGSVTAIDRSRCAGPDYASTMPKAEYAYTPAVAPSARYNDDECAARDAYNDAMHIRDGSGGGGWRARIARFGKGTW